MTRPITLEEATEMLSAPDGLMSQDDYWQMKEWEAESKAEREAEGAWLRAAENASWQEDYLESLVESGLRARW